MKNKKTLKVSVLISFKKDGKKILDKVLPVPSHTRTIDAGSLYHKYPRLYLNEVVPKDLPENCKQVLKKMFRVDIHPNLQ